VLDNHHDISHICQVAPRVRVDKRKILLQLIVMLVWYTMTLHLKHDNIHYSTCCLLYFTFQLLNLILVPFTTFDSKSWFWIKFGDIWISV